MLKSIKSLQSSLQQSALAASGSYNLIASILIFTFLGRYIDNKISIDPVGIIVGLFTGLIVGFYQLIKITQSNK